MGDLDSMVPLAHPSQSPKPQLDRFNHCRAYGRNPQTHRQTTERQKTPVARPHLQCESKILPPPYLQAMLRQQLKIYKKNRRLLLVHICANYQILFNYLLTTCVTKLCHIKRDHLVIFYISLQTRRIPISLQQYDRSPQNLARWRGTCLSSAQAVKINFF